MESIMDKHMAGISLVTGVTAGIVSFIMVSGLAVNGWYIKRKPILDRNLLYIIAFSVLISKVAADYALYLYDKNKVVDIKAEFALASVAFCAILYYMKLSNEEIAVYYLSTVILFMAFYSMREILYPLVLLTPIPP